ncbi:hypothetical protein QBZ16_003251 [Prototheca wickerhamii]|uniref:Uncharacterized protein n=1 Tax=Prototheca wickerhamii TaxID=3111 RepID=A0AAD9IH70_PROWI|nr:hypothetical protein QBZ16_003251 [Prototheca wickerhamii]
MPREDALQMLEESRRENTEDSLDKLRMIRENVLKALEIFEMLVRRERKKRDLLFVATDLQQLQLKLRFEPRSRHDQIEEKYWAAAKNKDEELKPLYEQPNPYSEWLNKDELAQAVLEKLSAGLSIADMVDLQKEDKVEVKTEPELAAEDSSARVNGAVAKESGRRAVGRSSRSSGKF